MTDTDTKNNESFALPSNKTDRDKIKTVLHEVVGQLQMIDDRKSVIKDHINALHEEYAIPKKVLNRLAKTMYNHDYDDVTHEIDVFQLCFEGIVQQ